MEISNSFREIDPLGPLQVTQPLKKMALSRSCSDVSNLNIESDYRQFDLLKDEERNSFQTASTSKVSVPMEEASKADIKRNSLSRKERNHPGSKPRKPSLQIKSFASNKLQAQSRDVVRHNESRKTKHQ